MHSRGIAVMQTGEGKTLTATLPLFLASLNGRGSHLATANDYLAQRDAQLMRPLFELLGCSVGIVCSDTGRPERLAAYACDVTYTTAKEIGFDFLRDRLLRRQMETGQVNLFADLLGQNQGGDTMQPVQRELNFVVVDEADSILIDEARTPLVVSSISGQQLNARADLYRWSAEVAPQFTEEHHYTIELSTKRVQLSKFGREFLRKLTQPASLDTIPILDLYEQLELAIVVHHHYFKDRHYVVRNGQVVIVDEFTGRLAEGRKWRSGLHQAIEAREGLLVSMETGEAAKITIQDLFLKYKRIAGMTGTVANSARELERIYKVRVHQIPTHRPPRREQCPDLVFATAKQKWAAIVDEVARLHAAGRPVLVGTRSIDKSEMLSHLLAEKNIPHEVLNARHLAREADIISAAGQFQHVTVATNMAGRGTDIQLDHATRELGGMHVICSELHESSRIDRQLIGRCGRQGDPGSFRQFMALDDDILQNGLTPRSYRQLQHYGGFSSTSLSRFAPLFQAAQRRIESRHFSARKILMYQEHQRQEIQREMGLDPYLDSPSN